MLKLPPFGAKLHRLIKSGFRPTNDINLFIGTKSWDKGNNFSVSYPERTLILPSYLSPSQYYWPVKSCDVLIHDTSYSADDWVDEIVIVLFRYEASNIRFISSDYKLTCYKKGL